jgi:hypothetical protein
LPTEQDLAMARPNWLLLLVHKNSLEVLEKKFMLLWHAWSVHNKMIHEGASPFIASSVTFLTRYMAPLSNIWQQGDYVDSKGKRSLAPVTSNTQV